MIPVPLGENADVATIVPPASVALLNGLKFFFVENAKTARRFLRKMGFIQSFETVEMMEIGFPINSEACDAFVGLLKTGNDIGILSEAGCPGVADPGAQLVALAHNMKAKVVPLVGPSSILLSLMASGLNGQNFCFRGYLPIDEKSKLLKIKEMEHLISKEAQTQIFIETPYRNHALLDSLLKYCPTQLQLCIACNIGEPDEFITTLSIEEWKFEPVKLHKKPTIFLLGNSAF